MLEVRPQTEQAVNILFLGIYHKKTLNFRVKFTSKTTGLCSFGDEVHRLVLAVLSLFLSHCFWLLSLGLTDCFWLLSLSLSPLFSSWRNLVIRCESCGPL